MITLQNISMHYGAKELFNNVNIALKPKNKYGLIGANGSGKSTFLKLLLKEEEQNSGVIEMPRGLKVGALKQDQFKYENDRIVDVVIQGNKDLWSAIKEQQALINKEDLNEKEGYRIAELEAIIAENDGYEAEANAEVLLSGLGIDEKLFKEPLSILSGGYKIRILLAQCLFSNPDIMLLDEPTNHLDILSIQWLENFLITKFKNILILISHDHDFLNSICNNILDIDYREITLYPGNYDYFIKEKFLRAEQIEHNKSSIEKKIEKDREFIERFRYKATKARQALSREKQIEKIEIPEPKSTSRIAPKFSFQQKQKSGREVMELTKLSQAYGETKLFQNLSCKIERGEKIAIIGQNGIGKSTLLKTVLGILPQASGEIKLGHNTVISYFSQDHKDLIKGNETVLKWFMESTQVSEVEKIRGELGKMLFTQDEVNKSVSVLSGGESTRLLFAKICIEKANVIALDEPTNHLDLESRVELARALKKFEGTIIFVSHDRKFIADIADRIIFLYSRGFVDFKGNYGDFREKYSKFFESNP